MFDWLRKTTTCRGAVLFRGNLLPRAEEFTFLEKQGIRVTPIQKTTGMQWRLTLTHPDWGTARLFCSPEPESFPRILIEHQALLTKEEKETALLGRSSVILEYDAEKRNILRDRKLALRFLNVIMGSDGLAAVDMLAERVWSRQSLDEELSHDADLDVTGIVSIHAVHKENIEDIGWLHTHGLAEVGAFDFDILEPSQDLLSPYNDLLRAITFAVLEHSLNITTPKFCIAQPGGTIRSVPVSDFNSLAARHWAYEVRDGSDDAHLRKRAVLCQPAGFFGRWSLSVKPSRYLSSPIRDGSIIRFSTEASDLMGNRARKTYDVFRQLAEEFAELELPMLVKIGYVTDGGGPDDKEHLWFQVHEPLPDAVDATLVNRPNQVARLNKGERQPYPIENLSAWSISSPIGQIDSTSMMIARVIRNQREEIKQIMADYATSQSPSEDT
jgi:hypothetical protein